MLKAYFAAFLVVSIACIVRMDDLERAVWSLSINRHGDLISRIPTVDASRLLWMRVAIGVFWPLYVSLVPSWNTHAWSEGLLSSYAIICRDKERILLCSRMTKIFWDEYLRERRIRTPRVYARQRRGAFKISVTPSDPEEIVIVKPNDDHCGRSIELRLWKDALETPASYDHVIQKYVSAQKGKSFRVVTCKVPKDDAFILQNYSLYNFERIASNRGSVVPIGVDQIAVANELCRCHTNDFHILPVISWDIVVDEYGEEYVLEGNAPGAVCWKHDCRKTLTKFDTVVRQWL